MSPEFDLKTNNYVAWSQGRLKTFSHDDLTLLMPQIYGDVPVSLIVPPILGRARIQSMSKSGYLHIVSAVPWICYTLMFALRFIMIPSSLTLSAIPLDSRSITLLRHNMVQTM